jgi:hypothetical protein
MEKRILKINSLMTTIAKEERHFFLNEKKGIMAKFELLHKVLHYKDEYEGISRPITSKMTAGDIMDWVSHGNTIRHQILEFTKFIETGKPQRILSRYWGISFKSQLVILKKAKSISFIDQIDFCFHDYTAKRDRYLCKKCKEKEALWKDSADKHYCEDCAV